VASAELLAACAILVAGTYLVRLLGVRASRDSLPAGVDRSLEQAIAVLLAAVAATSALYDGHALADGPRVAGVLAAVIAAALRCRLIVVVLLAAGVTAVLRSLG
jgi:branched-subunit amino acid transport protein